MLLVLFFINIYSIEIVFVSSCPHPNLYPILVFPIWDAKFPFKSRFILYPWVNPFFKKRFTLTRGWTNCWNSEMNHASAIWAPQALDGDTSREKGQLQQVCDVLSLLTRETCLWSWRHLLSPISSRKNEKFHASLPHYFDYYAGLLLSRS